MHDLGQVRLVHAPRVEARAATAHVGRINRSTSDAMPGPRHRCEDRERRIGVLRRKVVPAPTPAHTGYSTLVKDAVMRVGGLQARV